LQQLCMRIPGQDYTVKVDFEQARDFSVALCVLKRFGFDIGDYSQPIPTQSAYEPAQTLSFESIPDTGSRLSSITSLPCPGQYSSHNLNVNASGQINPLLMGGYSAAQLGAEQGIALSQSAANLPQLNPYNVFAGPSSYDNYRPRISSPLRNSLNQEDPMQHPPYSNHLFFGQPSLQRSHSNFEWNQAISSLPQHPYYLAANDPFQSSSYAEPEAALSELPNSTPVASGGITTQGPVPGKKDAIDYERRASHEFSRLLPQRRQLPFIPSPSKASRDNPEIEHKAHRSDSQSTVLSPPAKEKVESSIESRISDDAVTRRRTSRAVSKPTGRNTRLTKKVTPLTQDSGDAPEDRVQEPVPGKALSITVDIPDRKALEKSKKTGALSLSDSTEHSRAKTRTRTKRPNSKSIPANKPATRKPSRGPSQSVRKKNDSQSSMPLSKTKRIEDVHKAFGVLPTRQSLRQSEQRKLKLGLEITKPEPPPFTDTTKPTGSQNHSLSVIPWTGSENTCGLQKGDTESVFVITETMLQQVNGITSAILDQFEVDTKNGLDAGTSAQFYVDQIALARREYWCGELLGMESRQWASYL
jgi:hypothetical protein